ncbi:MAG: hypothetical protein PHE50_00205 [Dehalococcoidales bacterium]|nr:hypothetical protein [Dehalococcoidales bacterium]
MSLFGKVFGKSKDSDPNAGINSQLAALQPLMQVEVDRARRTEALANPLRESLFGRSQNFLGGGLDVTQTPSYAALKNQAENQFSLARDNALSSLPQGGALYSALTGLEGQKASNLTQAQGGLYENELARAFALGTGQAPTFAGTQGLTSLAASGAPLAAQQNAQAFQALGGLGSGIGKYLGSGSNKGGSTSTKGGGAGAFSGGSVQGNADYFYDL